MSPDLLVLILIFSGSLILAPIIVGGVSFFIWEKYQEKKIANRR